MNPKLLLAAALVVGIGAGAVVVAGDVLPGADAESGSESFPTATPEDGASDGGTTADSGESTPAGGTATATPPFGFTIDTIEQCGQTCRDVTSTLSNQQDTTADDVAVSTRIFAGQGTDGDVVWRGSEDVGTLNAGESYTATRQVELSFADALAVQNNDGWITVQTTVETADGTVTFTDERQVA